MNKYIIKAVIGLVAIGGMASCSEDYLDVRPVTDVTSATAGSSADNMLAAVNGIARQMYVFYQSSGQPYWLGFNGEASFMTYYGEFMGQDDYLAWPGGIGSGQLVNMEANTMLNAYMAIIGWEYCYKMIAQVNDVLAVADNPTGSSEEVNFARASLLTLRAHFYQRLLQVYAPRWQDSNNGEALTVVLRTEPTTNPLPMSSMNAVLEQIYSDLNTAIELYDKSGKVQRNNIGVPDRSIACGIYARAALLKNDWATAEKYAHEARQGYTLMSAQEYKNGFCVANREYMWTNSSLQTDIIGYVAWGTYWACNGVYPYNFSYGAGAMNKQLYDLIPEGDIRRDLYLMPDQFPEYADLFYDDTNVDVTSLNVYNGKNRKFARELIQHSFNMRPPIATDEWELAYNAPKNSDGLGDDAGICMPFGAQYKFWAVDSYGSDQYPFMRAAEMLLTEAEACAMQGKNTEAINLLKELNANRNPNYVCTATGGQALIDEVRLQRRIELWGEGFNWFDFKRWNLAVDRKGWKAGDPTSGNIPATAAVRIEPQDANKWVIWIPNYEVNYNPYIKESDLVR